MRPSPAQRLTSARSRLAAPLLLILAGCDERESVHYEEHARATLPGQTVSADAFDDRSASGIAVARLAAPAAPAAGEAQAAPDVPTTAPAKTATAGRKIIYNAAVDLVTDDLAKLEASLQKLVGSNGGYVADSNRTGATGSIRSGTWKIRVPVDNFDALLSGVSGLGELVSTRSNSEDVSAEYFDLEARQTAKKVEEARLLKHLSDSTGRLDEILAVERELSRVRSEIERMQGRLAVLANQTTLATITVSASEIKNYVPPNPPTLAERVGRTFQGSVTNLARFGEGALLFVVALAPWSPLIVIGGVLASFLLRWLVRRVRAEAQARAAQIRDALNARAAGPTVGA